MGPFPQWASPCSSWAPPSLLAPRDVLGPVSPPSPSRGATPGPVPSLSPLPVPAPPRQLPVELQLLGGGWMELMGQQEKGKRGRSSPEIREVPEIQVKSSPEVRENPGNPGQIQHRNEGESRRPSQGFIFSSDPRITGERDIPTSWEALGQDPGEIGTVGGNQEPRGISWVLGGVSAPQEGRSGSWGQLHGFLGIHQEPRELLVSEDSAEAALEEALEPQDGLNVCLVLGGKQGI